MTNDPDFQPLLPSELTLAKLEEIYRKLIFSTTIHHGSPAPPFYTLDEEGNLVPIDPDSELGRRLMGKGPDES